MTKFLIIGDLHGNKPQIYDKNFDAIIAPGDFCSDALRKYMFQALKIRIETKDNSINWYDVIPKKKAKKEVTKSLKDGRKILEYLNSFNKPVFALPGNWDWTGDKDWSFLNKDYWNSYLERQLIKKNKPLVSIGGHIHEHFGKDKLGKTIIINAGFGSFVNTILEIKDN